MTLSFCFGICHQELVYAADVTMLTEGKKTMDNSGSPIGQKRI
jgi:hypothetical protein